MIELFFVLLIRDSSMKIMYSLSTCCGSPLYNLEVYSKIRKSEKPVLHLEPHSSKNHGF
jgi:hypothetical protein